MLNFDQNLKIPLLADHQPLKYLGKIFSFHICRKYVTCCQKTWRGCQVNLKFCKQSNYVMPRKKRQNNLFTWGPQHGQNGIWNLQIFYIYFWHFFPIFTKDIYTKFIELESESKILYENGSRGTNLAWISKFYFYIGIAA